MIVEEAQARDLDLRPRGSGADIVELSIDGSVERACLSADGSLALIDTQFFFQGDDLLNAREKLMILLHNTGRIDRHDPGLKHSYNSAHQVQISRLDRLKSLLKLI